MISMRKVRFEILCQIEGTFFCLILKTNIKSINFTNIINIWFINTYLKSVENFASIHFHKMKFQFLFSPKKYSDDDLFMLYRRFNRQFYAQYAIDEYARS